MANWFKPCPAIAAAAVAVIHWGKLCRGLEGKHRIISQHFPLTAMDDGGGGLFEVRRGVGCNEKAIKFPANYVHFCVCADKLVFTNRRKKIKKKFRFRFSPLAVPKQNLKQVPNGRRQSGCFRMWSETKKTHKRQNALTRATGFRREKGTKPKPKILFF